jgi:DNA modification methylase
VSAKTAANARQLLARVLTPNSVDAVITSPPYPNEKDYTRTTRLESVLLGFLEIGKTCDNSRKGYFAPIPAMCSRAGHEDDRWVTNHAEIQRLAPP